VIVGDLAELGVTAQHAAAIGIASTLPATAGARTWAFAAGALDGLPNDNVLVLDTSARDARVVVTAGDGRPHERRVKAGDRISFLFAAGTPGPIRVTADQPVVVARALSGVSGATATAGVPSGS
jgi:hypothetical protein